MKRRAESRRRGAAIVEMAVTLIVFLMMVLGTLDLGLCVFLQHTVTEAARRGARLAIVHGSKAPPASETWSGRWGRLTIDAPLSNNSVPIAVALRPSLPGVDQTTTRVRVEWIDGGNSPGQRVRVTVTGSYTPFITAIFGIVFDTPTLSLSAASTMTISN